jgi:hypothetical protein
VHGAIENVTPDRREDAVLLPDRAIGETDFASQRFGAACLVHLPHQRRHPVGVTDAQAPRSRGERWNLPGIAKRSECFCRDGLESFRAFALIHLGEFLRRQMT